MNFEFEPRRSMPLESQNVAAAHLFESSQIAYQPVDSQLRPSAQLNNASFSFMGHSYHWNSQPDVSNAATACGASNLEVQPWQMHPRPQPENRWQFYPQQQHLQQFQPQFQPQPEAQLPYVPVARTIPLNYQQQYLQSPQFIQNGANPGAAQSNNQWRAHYGVASGTAQMLQARDIQTQTAMRNVVPQGLWHPDQSALRNWNDPLDDPTLNRTLHAARPVSF